MMCIWHATLFALNCLLLASESSSGICGGMWPHDRSLSVEHYPTFGFCMYVSVIRFIRHDVGWDETGDCLWAMAWLLCCPPVRGVADTRIRSVEFSEADIPISPNRPQLFREERGAESSESSESSSVGAIFHFSGAVHLWYCMVHL
jgi:hypothetical protein